MSDMLSQQEIDELINNSLSSNSSDSSDGILSLAEIDALGEIGNICMGTAATTLYKILGRRVNITTPSVEVTTIEKLSQRYPVPFVMVDVQYTTGLEGRNIMYFGKRMLK